LGLYLRARDGHAYAFAPQLFVGRRGNLSYQRVYVLVRRAGIDAGIVGARPHLLRYTFAHDLKAAGVSDEVIMALGGWRSHTVLARYGHSERTVRAVDAYPRVGSPG
jgi:integrase